jgi:putative endonuclease
MILVYAILSKVDGRIYVGQTQDIGKRVKEHNNGTTKSTKAYIPWTLFFYERCANREQARKREKYWKSGIGKEKLKLLLQKMAL